MSGFAKLDSGIIQSTIWVQPHDVLRVWIALLAMANQDGVVHTAAPALAHLCMIPLDRMREILRILESPDEDSRSAVDGGRRVMKIEGGWCLVNYAKYRLKVSAEEKREADRVRIAAKRAAYRAESRDVAECRTESQASGAVAEVAQAEAEAEADIAIGKNTATPAASPRAGDDSTALVGTFEGQPERPAAPNPVAPFAIALNSAGFRCTPMNPDLIAFAKAGGTVEHLQACAAYPECAGKPAVYVIRFARRELAEQANPVTQGAAHETPRRMSAVDRIEANIIRNRQQRAQAQQATGDVIDGECRELIGHVVPDGTLVGGAV